MTTPLVSLHDYEREAALRIPERELDFISGGAADEVTLHRTRHVYESIALRPRVLSGVERAALETTVLGHRLSLPILAAPSGGHGRSHPDGELATARACAAAGTLMILSSASSYTLEEVAAVSSGPLWFQQYLFKDPAISAALSDRAAAAGFSAICVTVDSALRAKRDRDVRNGYSYPVSRNYDGLGVPGDVGLVIDREASFDTLAALVARSSLPVVVKGVMTGEDAAHLVDAGAAAIIVSNHGGRQLDTTLTTIEALPEVVEAVDGRVEVLVDGGIRRGTDVIKALALGARAVLLGRPIFWGLACGGEDGVRSIFELLREELAVDLAMCGVANASAVDTRVLAPARPLDRFIREHLDYVSIDADSDSK